MLCLAYSLRFAYLADMHTRPQPQCQIPGCHKTRMHRRTIRPYCEMHKARFRRHGHFGLRDKSFHGLEKLPHTVDAFIQQHAKGMLDRDIVEHLRKQGFSGAELWTVRYRRRRLNIRKYASGEEKKHKAWVRQQALKKYGHRCELCGYHLLVETHHIVPKYQGGLHEVENLMIVCSNCHTLLTRKSVTLRRRSEIPRLRRRIRQLLRSVYPYLG